MHDTKRPLSILIVDDDIDTARTTAQLLTFFGHATRIAVRGEEAVRLAAGDPPDVLLLDLRMPGLDGCEVARRLGQQLRRRPPLIVAVTGCGSDTDRERAFDSGVNLYLVKPVEPGVLVSMMERIKEALRSDSYTHRGQDAANVDVHYRGVCHA